LPGRSFRLFTPWTVNLAFAVRVDASLISRSLNALRKRGDNKCSDIKRIKVLAGRRASFAVTTAPAAWRAA
jgi:hypothetical protein